jgi:hypothetical protein
MVLMPPVASVGTAAAKKYGVAEALLPAGPGPADTAVLCEPTAPRRKGRKELPPPSEGGNGRERALCFLVVLGAVTAFEGVVPIGASFPPLSVRPNGVMALGLRRVRLPTPPVPCRIGRNSGRPNPPPCALTTHRALWARTAYQTYPGRTRAGTPPARQPCDLRTGTWPINGTLWPFPGCSGSLLQLLLLHLSSLCFPLPSVRFALQAAGV